MSITALLLRLRANGGDVRLGPDDCLQVRRGSIKPAAWQVWKKRLKQDTAGVIAVLHEERATRYWEASGRDPQWWRTYPYARTAVAPSCRCDALPFSHVHLDPGPAPNLELLPGEDVWQRLKLLISEVPEGLVKEKHRGASARSR